MILFLKAIRCRKVPTCMLAKKALNHCVGAIFGAISQFFPTDHLLMHKNSSNHHVKALFNNFLSWVSTI